MWELSSLDNRWCDLRILDRAGREPGRGHGTEGDDGGDDRSGDAHYSLSHVVAATPRPDHRSPKYTPPR